LDHIVGVSAGTLADLARRGLGVDVVPALLQKWFLTSLAVWPPSYRPTSNGVRHDLLAPPDGGVLEQQLGEDPAGFTYSVAPSFHLVGAQGFKEEEV